MAELSAEERYEESYEASKRCHEKFCKQHEQWLSRYVNFMKGAIEDIEQCTRLDAEITEQAQLCNKLWENVDFPVHVVVIGVYNQGKSTMLNALLDDASNTRFKTSNVAQTREIQYEELDGNAIFSDFQIQNQKLKEMGCCYIISAGEIMEPAETGLRLLRIFERDDSYYRIYLYKVEESV